MKTIGLIGGISWESSAEYYRLINEAVKARKKGFHSAKCLMWSFDFAEIEALQKKGEWDKAAKMMVDAAHALERGGADCIVICANTMHRMAGDVQAAVDIPLLHVADATARAVLGAQIGHVGLLGTVYTMEQNFLKGRLSVKHGLEVMVPDADARKIVNDVIYKELVKGVVKKKSREAYLKIIDGLAKEGAQGVILGCTEIGMLIKPGDASIPTFDTTTLHAAAAVEFALG
ncbi:MAG: aspartate/glutamate racemase family protein [Chloroflexi bacterium]|nr:aspartate/glutamate racemase family protein [Chloroflexota bacterium]